jgi:hypothetical protein
VFDRELCSSRADVQNDTIEILNKQQSIGHAYRTQVQPIYSFVQVAYEKLFDVEIENGRSIPIVRTEAHH